LRRTKRTAITFIHPDGRRERIDAYAAETVMLAATSHGVAGILAECGGNAMCATCHVYVESGWLDRLPAMTSEEDALLDGAAAERLPNSRLSCQIKVTPELDGLELRLPRRQT
jgi:2Fe-2S ferredoxin